MQKKKMKSRKREQDEGFLTNSFLERQIIALRAKLEECWKLERTARNEMTSIQDGPRDLIDCSAVHQRNEEAALNLEECRKKVLDIFLAMGLIRLWLGEGRNTAVKYGECIGDGEDNCGKPISKKRLLAIPWALRCKPHQEKVEARESSRK